MRLPGTARLGMLALCLGMVVFGGVYLWVNTRTLIPVDVPVSLAPGHIRTGDFKINVEAYFSIQIGFPLSGDPACLYANGLQTRRLISVGGMEISVPGSDPTTDGGLTKGSYLGSFYGKPGHYSMDIEVLSTSQNLDSCQPRLQIEASPYDFNQWQSTVDSSRSFFLFCVYVGSALLLAFATTRPRKHPLEELRLRIFVTDSQVGPAPPVNLKTRRPLPTLLIFGILGVAMGVVVFVATMRWYDSRKFAVVDLPVYLAPGHIKTGNFIVQLKGTYGISFDLGRHYFYDCAEYLVLKSRWELTRDGQLAAQRERGGNDSQNQDAPIEGPDLGNFDAEQGTYLLDIEIISDPRCLNFSKPRLRVYLSASDRGLYDDLDAKLLLFSLFSLCVGLVFLRASYIAWRDRIPIPLPLQASLPEQRPAWGITGLHFRRPTSPSPGARHPARNSSTVAVVFSLTWFTVFVPMCFIYFGGTRTSQGIMVSLPRQGVQTVAMAPELTAPLIEIEVNHHVFLNYKQTTWEKLPAGLDQALRLLPMRVVYLDADNDAQFMDAAQAIDISQGLGAKVILMTPHSKAENRWRAKVK